MGGVGWMSVKMLGGRWEGGFRRNLMFSGGGWDSDQTNKSVLRVRGLTERFLLRTIKNSMQKGGGDHQKLNVRGCGGLKKTSDLPPLSF